jgi:hypothetical protein
MTTIILKDFTERTFGSTSGSYHEAWELIEQIVADEFRCQPESISLIEDESGEEMIHISGEPKARLVYRNRGL